MKKEYKIITKKTSKVHPILNRDIILYRYVGKNENAVGQKTHCFGRCTNPDGTDIYTLVKPIGKNEHSQNRIALEKLNAIKNKIIAERDDLATPVTWSQLVTAKEIERQKQELESSNFLQELEKVWGKKDPTGLSNLIFFFNSFLPDLAEASVKEVLSANGTKRIRNTIEALASGELLSPKGKAYSQTSIIKRWYGFTKAANRFLSDDYVDRVYTKKYTPRDGSLEKPVPQLKGKATTDEVSKIYGVNVDDMRWKDVRKAWLFSCLYSGMRFTTMVSLKWEHLFDEEDNHLRIYVPTQIKTKTDLEMWIKKDNILLELIGERKGDSDYVFDLPRNSNEGVANTYIYQTFRAIKDRAGIHRNDLTAKLCRHTHAYRMIAATGDIYKTSKKLGHTSTKITEQNYVRHGKKFYMDSAKALSNYSLFEVPTAT